MSIEQIASDPLIDDRPLVDKSTNVMVGPGGISLVLVTLLLCGVAVFWLIGSGQVTRANFDAWRAAPTSQPVVNQVPQGTGKR